MRDAKQPLKGIHGGPQSESKTQRPGRNRTRDYTPQMPKSSSNKHRAG